jgi:hypothetical protein
VAGAAYRRSVPKVALRNVTTRGRRSALGRGGWRTRSISLRWRPLSLSSRRSRGRRRPACHRGVVRPADHTAKARRAPVSKRPRDDRGRCQAPHFRIVPRPFPPRQNFPLSTRDAPHAGRQLSVAAMTIVQLGGTPRWRQTRPPAYEPLSAARYEAMCEMASLMSVGASIS